ncbi:hypothetical protein MKW14_04325 [Streptomyces sp. CME 23]|nr:hypothetical protein [Streptomyces sp. CME 23]MCH5671076.1 hypothetical protein [Streptomyces sp. CME 23]
MARRRRPITATEPRPLVYTIHGGGMVAGSHRLGIPLDSARLIAVA